MKIKVINPNSNKKMTEQIKNAINVNIRLNCKIDFDTIMDGPDSIESVVDETYSAAALLEYLRTDKNNQYSGYVIACFGDPGLDAARELMDAPIIGTAEAAMQMASLVSTRFSIVTTVARMKNYTENLVYKYGFERKCKKIRAIGCEVNSLLKPNCSSNDIVEHECREAIKNDDIGAIVLGCAGMANLANDLSRKLEIPVIDGVLSGICLAEALFKCDIKTSKLEDYGYPNKKIYRGIYSHCGE